MRERASFHSDARPTGDRPPVAAETAAQALSDVTEIAELIGRVTPQDGLIATDRTLEYLKWRYASAPLLDYRAIREDGAGGLRGLALFRVRTRGRLWESTLAELIAHPDDQTTMGRLLHRVRHAAAVDHVTASFPSGSIQSRSARRRGFISAPGGLTMIVNPLSDHIRPDPRLLSSWAVGLGDLEVF